MYLNHKQTIKRILDYNGEVFIWGMSEITKRVIKECSEIKNKISYIIDINVKLHNSHYEDILITSPVQFEILDNPLIIIWGNHVLDIVKYLQEKNMNSYIIDYSLSKNYIPFGLTIEIDKLPKNNDENDINYLFSKKVFDYLYKNDNIQIFIKPYIYKTNKSHSAEEMLKIQFLDPQNIEKDRLLVSYHSVGDTNPQIFRWKESYLQGMISFDTNGYSGWSSFCNININQILKNISMEESEVFFARLVTKYIYSNISKYKQKDIKKYKFPKKFIFFPLQTINDTVMLHSYFEPIKLIESVIKIVKKHNIPLVIKRHPRCTSNTLKELLLKYENKEEVIIYDGSIHNAIAKCETVYVINSGVGFEALLHLKPVITFGKSDYMGVTRNVKNLQEIEKEPFFYLYEEEKIKIKNFLYYYINNKCINIEDDEQLEKAISNFIINYLNMRGL
ncbi:hypothetical protein [Arcobacter sp.]|uniref:capsular polysaccharide export protein, LipB/KpsS family n=1 Tax=Arcobacter sp. TaxID=1872629 RepID=UPI003D1254AA